MRKDVPLPLTKKHILCVDDNSDTCELVSHILREYELTSAYSMADAVKRATAEKFDLYILDYHLPDGTGLELCLMLRTFDHDTPILFATATDEIIESQVVTAGAQGMVKKNSASFVDDLQAKVSQMLKV
jgi:CheY-like chemotaxis protein